MVQGRFLFYTSRIYNRWENCLNPFGSGTFLFRKELVIKLLEKVLIPLVQGRFYSVSAVLPPLFQWVGVVLSKFWEVGKVVAFLPRWLLGAT